MEHIDSTVVAFASNETVESLAFQGDLFAVKDQMPGFRWNVSNKERNYDGEQPQCATGRYLCRYHADWYMVVARRDRREFTFKP